MRRRQFIAGLGSAAAWPVVVRGQQNDRIRRVGTLWLRDESDPLQQMAVNTFRTGLAELGWVEGRNLRMDHRWNPITDNDVRTYAKELVDLSPDVLTTGTSRLVRALQEQTKSIPIVMLGAGDPVARGLVKSLSRPEGNTTGITDIFVVQESGYSIAGKWLELLKQCMPSLRRVALIGNPSKGINIDNYATPVARAASQNGVRAIIATVGSAEDIERVITQFASEPDGGLIVLPPPFSVTERQVINRLAAQYRLPVIYQERSLAIDGGLLAYGPDSLEIVRQGATYVDRLLRGTKPSELPVQFPTKFILTVNLKTAKAMGLTIPEAFLLRADEVIE